MNTERFKLPFLRSRADLDTYHGLSIDEDSFIEMALKVWEQIGNRDTKIVKLEKVPVNNGIVEVPCGLYRLLAVTIDQDNCIDNHTGSYIHWGTYRPIHTLSHKAFQPYLLEAKGNYIPYRLTHSGIEVDNRLSEVNLIYQELDMDEEGLPLISEKESYAISWKVAYLIKHREMLKGLLKDPSIIQYLKQESDRLIRDARVFDRISQNLIDSVLNIKTSHDRKKYNRSYWVYKDV